MTTKLHWLGLIVLPLALTACGGGGGGGATSSAPSSVSSASSVSSVAVSSEAESSVSSAEQSSVPSNPDDPWITALEAAEDMGAGVNLGNTFEGDQNPSTFESSKPKIDAYYAKGFRNVRVPITWTEIIDGDRLADPLTGVVDRENPRLAELIETVDYALSLEGMYVVINAHHEYALKDNSATRSAVLEQIWEDVADIFSDRSPRLMFQLLNEPHATEAKASAPMPGADLRLMSGKAYDKIRAVNPLRIVIIGGDQWFGPHELARAWPNVDAVGGGEDDYVMASFHHYQPWEFSGQDGDHAMDWTASMMQASFNTAAAWASSTGGGMPIYVSEWGVGWQNQRPVMTCNNIRKWYQEMHYTEAASRNYPTAVWDDGGWFKIFSHATETFDNNLVDCIITGQCAWDGDERFNAGCD